MNFFKRLFRRPAILLVTLYAKLIYRQGVDAAERRHAMEGNTIYLASKTFTPDRLMTYDRQEFRAHKQLFGVAARLLTMNTLRSGCYYHTADRWGQNALSADEVEVRKKAFIKERLQRAKLI